MKMPGQSLDPNSYGRDYQGIIKDQETGYNAFDLRMFDGRIGRWLTTDPMGQHHSPYLGMSNNPVSFIDPTGGEDGPSEVEMNLQYAKENSFNRQLYDDLKGMSLDAMSPEQRAQMQVLSGANYNTQGANRFFTLASLGGYTAKDGKNWSYSDGGELSYEELRVANTRQQNTGKSVGDISYKEGLGLDASEGGWYGSSYITGATLGGKSTLRRGAEIFARLFGDRPTQYSYNEDGDVEWVSIANQASRDARRDITNGGHFLRIPPNMARAVARVVTPTGKFYSVAYEMTLSPNSYPGVSRYMHFKEANITLDVAMKSNPMLGGLGISVPRSASGSIIGQSPANWVWHHNTSRGVMQLVPKSQHPNIPGGIFWETMHPGGVGGYSIWGN